MAKFCSHCGNELSDNETFCSRCGTNYQSTAPIAPVAQPQQTNYQQPPTQMQPQQAEMTTGRWVGTIILTTWFGIISIILCIVWGFSDNGTPTPKKNFCRGMLVIQLIGMGIAIFFSIIFFAVVLANFDSIQDFFQNLANSF